MKKENITTTLRPDYKEYLAKLAKKRGLSLGQTIEFLIDQYTDREIT